MRSNIDLTEDRDFPESSNLSTNRIEVSIFKGFFKIPWNLHPITSELEFELQEDMLFPTGNKNQIKAKLQTNRVCSGRYCDRCGVSLQIIPWKNLFGLCEKCNEKLALEYGRNAIKIPWRS